MRRMKLVAAAAAIFVGSVGAAPVAAPASVPASVQVEEPTTPRQCFSTVQVRNFRTANAQTVYLKVGHDTVYELNTAGACTDVDGAYQLAIVSEDGGSRLCSGDWATIVVPGSARPVQQCRVRISKVLSDAEVAALPARDRP